VSVRRGFAAAALLAAALVSRSAAQTVLAFEDVRCYAGGYQYWLTGNAMSGPYNQLLARGYTVQTTSVVSAATLAGNAVFVTGVLDPGATLAPFELADLQAWVAGGGSLLLMGENGLWSNLMDDVGTLFGAASFGGDGVNHAPVIVAPTHPTISGPFGTVGSLGQLLACGSWTNVASFVTVVTTLPDTRAGLLAFGYGSGRVVLLNDSGYFAYPPNYTPDNAILWDNTIDWLSNTVCTGSATSYCTSSTTSHGCNPALAASGLPTAGAPSGFTLTASSVEGQRSGLIFYGASGPLAIPWASGSTSFLCVKPPTQRTPVQNAGGTAGTCSGQIGLDFLAYLAANPSALGAPGTDGQAFHAQCWFRDPPAVKTTNLSDGLTWMLCP
jgi:hypothetical protein